MGLNEDGIAFVDSDVPIPQHSTSSGKRTISSSLEKRSSAASSSSKRKKALSVPDGENIIDELKNRNSYIQDALGAAFKYKFHEALNRIQGVPNISNEAVWAMMELMDSNPHWIQAVMILEEGKLKSWIEMQVRKHATYGSCNVWNDV